jgi:hypothetical protein
MQCDARPRSASVESAAVSSRDEYGSNRPEIQYGSDDDSDEQPTPSQYDYERVANEAAYDLLENDEKPKDASPFFGNNSRICLDM